MAFGTIQLGRLALREALTAAAEKASDAGVITLSVSGQEACPPLVPGEVAQIQDDLRGLAGTLVPVTFTDKPDRSGYYTVSSPQASLMSWGAEVITCDWQIQLVRAGSPSEVDVESRLSGPLTRQNAWSVVGERWHCPPGGHTGYWSSSTQPTTLTRTGLDGPLVVYRGVPLTTSPRYSCELAAYPVGRARFSTPVPETGVLRERSGTAVVIDPVGGWELHNGLVRARWDGSGLRVAAHNGTGWVSQRVFTVSVAGVALGAPAQVSLLRNDYETVTARLLWNRAPAGRATVDLTVRRGARLVEGYLQSLPSSTLAVALASPVTTTSASGYITASADDASSNRYMLGSAATFTASTPASSITATAATALDFCVGHVVTGGSAPSGDTAASLYQQYLASPTESVRCVRR